MQILIVKLSSLGDVVQTMPVVHDMQQRLPGAAVDWVVEEAFAPLVARVAGVRRVLPIAERRWRKSRWDADTRRERAAFDTALRQQAYDAVIDFQGLIKSALVARRARRAPGGYSATYTNASDACGCGGRCATCCSARCPCPARIHAVARYRLLAAQALGYGSDGAPVSAFIPSPLCPRCLTRPLCPLCSYAAWCWPTAPPAETTSGPRTAG